MEYPTISIIIPRRRDDSAEAAIQAVLQSEYPQDLLEIIEVLGENPSKQRNTGAAVASGDILYFLDNDSIVTPGLFSRVVKYYVDSLNAKDHELEARRWETLAGVGGPNLTPQSDGFLQKISGYALASPFAHFSMCARYTPTGAMRYAGEKELILCNLSIHRETFLRENGFHEAMYPNEENEFINRLQKKGYLFIYDPEARVYRSRRKRFWGFIRQLFHYGGGRAAQMLLEGFSGKSLFFFLPLGLLGYLLVLPLVYIGGKFFWWSLLPLALYGGLATLSAFRFAIQERHPLLVIILPIWYLLMHLAYGAGLLHGFGMAGNLSKKEPKASSSSIDVVFRKNFDRD